MSNDAELTNLPSGAAVPMRSPAAERMRAYRERRKAGLCCLMIELHVTDIDELVRRKLLNADARADPNAILSALYRHLDDTLYAPT